MDPRNFTDCWNDEERMNFLFSAFPASKAVNPHHWDTKLTFWTKLIKDMCMHSKYAYISWENLFSKLSRHGRMPLGLQVVFDEMVTRGDIVSTAEYTRDIHANESWVGWGLNWCVKKPVSWMADKVLSPIKTRPGRNMKTGQFVMTSALCHKCTEVVAKFHAAMAREDQHGSSFHGLNIISYSELAELTKDIIKGAESLDLVLATLRRDKKVEVTVIGEKPMANGNSETTHDITPGEKYIKFAKKSEKRVAPFTEVDTGIVQLHRTKLFLEKRIDQAYKEIEQCTTKARECLKSGQRTKAKSALRKRKRLEAGLEKKEKTLSNVEELLESIHQCKTDKMIMDTYKAGITAYRDISNGLDATDVQDTMDEVSAVLDNQADISSALSSPVCADADLDSSDLEAELAALMNGQSNGVEDMNDLCKKMGSVEINGEEMELPSVPSHSPKREPNDVGVSFKSKENRCLVESG